jgi:hypothetical protein
MPLAAAALFFAGITSAEVDYARLHCIFSVAGTVQKTEPWMRTPAQIVKNIEVAEPKTVVIHFHGGLVDAQTGMDDAYEVGQQIYKGTAYPVHFVWESGAAYATAPPAVQWGDWGPRIFKSSPGLGSDEGPFPVPLPENGDTVGLRPFLLPMRSGWRQIKRYAELTCDPRVKDAAVPKFLDSFLPYWDRHPSTRVVLVSHSAGALLVGHMLELLAARQVKLGDRKFELIMAAPGCTYEFVALRSYLFNRYIGHVRMFGLSDPIERADLVSKYIPIRGVDRFFHGSILYLVSNHLEERHDTMVLGMQRFPLLAERRLIDRDLTAREQEIYAKVQKALHLNENTYWSDCGACGSHRHIDFFYDPKTILTMRGLLEKGF